MRRVRLDRFLVERGLCGSRERAREHILAGEVRVGGIVTTRPASQVAPDADVTIDAEQPRYVSRGGLKLEQALDAFGLSCEGRRVMDVGASTGGFTDCVLQRGAARVYAVDVGYGQLAWKLRCDERVVVMERTNIRELDPASLPEGVDLAVIDCSFIGLQKVLRPVRSFLRPGADVVALVKPQFEVGRAGIGKGGVVRDADVRAGAIERVRAEATELGFEVVDGVDCDTHGPSGNVEYLLRLRVPVLGEWARTEPPQGTSEEAEGEG
jgi:23S rRNA (cytidine1920-2'-O)/16S rRNA (cytidine1409-2'-O)-methyltransferase